MDKYGELTYLGKGAFAEIYKTNRKGDGEICVLKKITTSRIPPLLLAMMKDEAKIQGMVVSDHVVKVYDSFFDGDITYIEMEYCNNRDTFIYMRHKKAIRQPFTEPEIISFFYQTLKALNAIHSLKIVHRDLKPENIFLHQTDNEMPIVKIGDFGFSLILDTDGNGPELVGSMPYIAPEILNQSSYDNKIDIWSIGCILYEMAEATLLFGGDSVEEIMEKVKSDDIIPKLSSNRSESMNQLYLSMVNRNPSLRLTTEQLLKNPLFREISLKDSFIPKKTVFILTKPIILNKAIQKKIRKKIKKRKIRSKKLKRSPSIPSSKHKILRKVVTCPKPRLIKNTKVKTGPTHIKPHAESRVTPNRRNSQRISIVKNSPLLVPQPSPTHLKYKHQAIAALKDTRQPIVHNKKELNKPIRLINTKTKRRDSSSAATPISERDSTVVENTVFNYDENQQQTMFMTTYLTSRNFIEDSSSDDDDDDGDDSSIYTNNTSTHAHDAPPLHPKITIETQSTYIGKSNDDINVKKNNLEPNKPKDSRLSLNESLSYLNYQKKKKR